MGPKKPRKKLYQSLSISMVTEEQVPETSPPNYITSRVPWRRSSLSFLIRVVSTSMLKPESERSKMGILYAFHQRRNIETIADILAVIMCGMPRGSLKVVCGSTVPLNTLAPKIEEEIKKVEGTGSLGYPEEDLMWPSAVPVT